MKQTEIGMIPDDWEVVNVGDCTDILNGGTPSTNIPDYWNGDIVWVTPSDITKQKSKYLTHSEKTITNEGIRHSSAVLLPQGTILLCSRATIGDLTIAGKQVATNQGFKNLICKKKVNNEFLYYALQMLKPKMREQAFGSTFLEISKSALSRIQFSLPPLPEQKKIAEVLSDMDNLIETVSTLIEKKKMIRTGTLQKLLTPKADWVEKKLGEIFNIHKGIGLSKEKLSSNGIYRCLLYGELFTKYGRIITSVVSSTNFPEGILSKDGDILMPGSTTTKGEDLAIASSIHVSGVYLGGDVFCYRPKIKISSDFMAFLLPTYVKEIVKFTQGVTIIHLQGNNMQEMCVKIPPTKIEQQRIARILSDMDEEISVLEQKKEKLVHIKQGAMQTLLTGQIRL